MNQFHKKSTLITILLFSFCCFAFFTRQTITYFQYESKSQYIPPNDRQIPDDTEEAVQKLYHDTEALIQEKMKEGKIPGLSVCIVKDGNTLYKSGFGYASLERNIPATSSTLYQIGSNSKAFTALGVLQMQKDGLININDTIQNYIPWLTYYYEDKEVDIRIEEFLHHTSGISSATISEIPQLDEAEDALEKTVKHFNHLQLVSRPGDKYEYATINYDILGLLIQTVSGMSYEDYMQQYVLDSMHLESTYMYQSSIDKKAMASGYKLGFFAPRLYQAPPFEGNKPAGYIISNADDMAEWLKIQIGTSDTSLPAYDLIKSSHEPNKRVASFGKDMHYAAGWIVYDNNGTEISHSGSNPNFSSYIVFRPEDKIGVAVLSNTKTYYTSDIANSIMKMFSQNHYESSDSLNFDQVIDQGCTIIFAIFTLVTLFITYKIIIKVRILVKEPGKLSFKIKSKYGFLLRSILFLLINTLLFMLPQAVFQNVNWSYLIIWNPFTVQLAFYSIIICIWILYIKYYIQSLQVK